MATMQRTETKKTLSTRARHKVCIQYKTTVPDGEGGFDAGWTNASYDPVWADVSPLMAKQVHEYKTIGVDATHLIRIAGAISISEEDRIQFGSRTFEVLTVEDLQERGIEKVCTCLERR